MLVVPLLSLQNVGGSITFFTDLIGPRALVFFFFLEGL